MENLCVCSVCRQKLPSESIFMSVTIRHRTWKLSTNADIVGGKVFSGDKSTKSKKSIYKFICVFNEDDDDDQRIRSEKLFIFYKLMTSNTYWTIGVGKFTMRTNEKLTDSRYSEKNNKKNWKNIVVHTCDWCKCVDVEYLFKWMMVCMRLQFICFLDRKRGNDKNTTYTTIQHTITILFIISTRIGKFASQFAQWQRCLQNKNYEVHRVYSYS